MSLFLKLISIGALVVLVLILWLIHVIRKKFRGFAKQVTTQVAIHSQPTVVHLRRERGLAWQDRDTVAERVAAFKGLGFRPLGNYRIEELPDVQLVGLGHPEEGFGAVIYENSENGLIWNDLVARYNNGDLLTVSDAPAGDELTSPPFAEKIYEPGAPPTKLYALLCESLGAASRIPFHPDNFKRLFEEAWEREQVWRLEESPEVTAGDTDGEKVDLMAGLPLVDAQIGGRLGLGEQSLTFIRGVTETPLQLLTLRGVAPDATLDEMTFPGQIMPSDDEPDTVTVILDVAAALVPAHRADEMISVLQASLVPKGIQALRTTHGAKDFSYLFETGVMPASSFSRNRAILVFFAAPNEDALFWARQTNAANYDHDTRDILAKLAAWSLHCELRILGAGFDWVELEILTLPDDPHAFAKGVIDYCPDLLDELLDEATLEKLEEPGGDEEDAAAAALAARLESGKRKILLWWD